MPLQADAQAKLTAIYGYPSRLRETAAGFAFPSHESSEQTAKAKGHRKDTPKVDSGTAGTVSVRKFTDNRGPSQMARTVIHGPARR